MIRAFLFDVDGVLADTLHISLGLTSAFYKAKGYDMPEETVLRHVGVGMEELLLGPGREKGIAVDYDEAMAFFSQRYSSALSSRNPALPGGKNLIEEAQASGILVAAVSSAPRWRVEENLRAIGVEPSSLDLVVAAGDVKRNKPYGDAYTFALVSLGVDPKEAIVFEDSTGGIRSGKNAGCWVCGLTTTVTSGEAKASGADAVVKDLSAFPGFTSREELDELFRALRKSEGAVKYGANWITPRKLTEPWDSVVDKAISAAFKAQANAYSPYSGVKIGAAVLSAATGMIYSGCNVENAAYGSTICAERNAMTTAVAAEGVVGLDLIVVSSDMDEPATPCGSCRQMMSEFSRPDTPVVFVSSRGARRDLVFSDILPLPFEFPED